MTSAFLEPRSLNQGDKILSARILIADDSPIVRLMLERALSNLVEHTTIDQVASGLEVFDYLETQQPDIILLDILMPKGNGYEVCKQIKSTPALAHIPIIIVTAFSSKQNLAQCLQAGADDFVGKPVNEIEIRARVHSMLRLKKQHDELLKTQIELKSALERLDSALQLRKDMASMIVHDLRNPLSVAMLGCEILETTELTDSQTRNVLKIGHELNYLNALIEDLLVISRIESGKLTLHRESVCAKTLLSQACDVLEPKLEKTGLTLVEEYSASNLMLTVEPLLLRRVVENLLSNAIKFSPKNGKITVRIGENEAACPVIQVIDEGQGVPGDLKQIIFQKYEIGHELFDVQQIGLGLAFCKMVIEAHGGRIHVEDSGPTGSIFTVELLPD